MVSVAVKDETQKKNTSGMNGCLKRGKGTALYRIGNTARVEIPHLRFLRLKVEGSRVNTTNGIQLARRIRGNRA